MITRTKHPKGTGARIGYAALGLGALLVAACAGLGEGRRDARDAPTYKPGAGPYVFKITFSGTPACPANVDADFKNCDASLSVGDPRQQHDCARAKGGQVVQFDTTPAGQSFALQFDPFGKSSVPAAHGAQLPLPTPRKGGKHYTFSVLSGSCPPLDPQIIVD